MAAVKWIFVVLFGLGSAGSLAMAFTGSGAKRSITQRTAPEFSLRQFPTMVAVAGTPKTSEPVAAKTPAPVAVKTPEPVAAKTPEPVAAKTPEPVAAKTPEPAAAKTPEPVVAKVPVPVAAVPKPAAEGMINLRASDTADVYLDGKKLGGSPLLGIKARVGNHKVRFDCYDAAGNTVAGPIQTVVVKADAESDVEYPCPVE